MRLFERLSLARRFGRGADGDPTALRRALRECVDHRPSDTAAGERAGELVAACSVFDSEQREAFLRLLATEFDVSPERARAAARRVVEAPTDEALAKATREAREELEAPWARLFRVFLTKPGGLGILVQLREDARRLLVELPEIRALEEDLRAELARQLVHDSLELRRITWNSPASLLERLSRAEAVHAMAGWDDLKNRLDPDRRFFAYFHPRLPDEPLVFIQVALVRGMADSIEALLDPAAPVADVSDADSAIFYSISNAHPGLAGISFGSLLVKDVVEELRRELPRLRTFATLSPIPGFRDWAQERIGAGAQVDEPVAAAVADAALPDDPDAVERLRRPLLRLCATYLLHAHREDGRALDPVANFHLGNGAEVARLNWLADRSPEGLSAALGIMVNYVYRLDRAEARAAAYAHDGSITASHTVQRLAHADESNG
jgi:malonyl-CoA decarboxylase